MEKTGPKNQYLEPAYHKRCKKRVRRPRETIVKTGVKCLDVVFLNISKWGFSGVLRKPNQHLEHAGAEPRHADAEHRHADAEPRHADAEPRHADAEPRHVDAIACRMTPGGPEGRSPRAPPGGLPPKDRVSAWCQGCHPVL